MIQLTLERQLAEKYCNLGTNVKQSTDFGVSDQKVIPSKHHRVVGKESGQTHAVERLNHTFRQPNLSLSERESIFLQKSGKLYGHDWVLYTRRQCRASKDLSFHPYY